MTDRSEGEDALPPHLISVLDAATEITEDQRARAAALLTKHVNTFPAPGSPITGRTDAVVHEIDTGSTRPIRCNPRKLSPKKIKIQQELVDQMLEDGQIEPIVSAWSSPTVLVTKNNGSTHFCVDYRRLNARTKKDAFPLPRIDDSLNFLSGQAWFSTLDLASGYWQVRLSENAKPKTAFATHSGLFQFAVMPFGLCKGGNNTVPKRRMGKRVLVYPITMHQTASGFVEKQSIHRDSRHIWTEGNMPDVTGCSPWRKTFCNARRDS